MAFKIEKDWITKAGLRAVVIGIDTGNRAGYVGVPSDHPLFGAEYSATHPRVAFPAEESIGKRGILTVMFADPEAPRIDLVFDVHGSLTYSGGGEGSKYPVESGLWWFGYDCAHAGDAPDPALQSEQAKRFAFHDREAVVRSLDYCEAECESLAEQLFSRLRPEPELPPLRKFTAAEIEALVPLAVARLLYGPKCKVGCESDLSVKKDPTDAMRKILMHVLG